MNSNRPDLNVVRRLLIDTHITVSLFLFISAVALRFTSSTDLLGLTLPLEVVTKAAKGESNMVLGVRLGSTRIPEEILKSALVKHFSRHTGFKAECEIINGIGFLTFDDPEGLYVSQIRAIGCGTAGMAMAVAVFVFSSYCFVHALIATCQL